MKIRMSLLIGSLLLASCSGPSGVAVNSRSKEDPGWKHFATNSFEISYPEKAQYRFDRDNGSIAFATNGGLSVDDLPNDYLIEIYPLLTTDCNRSVTGASKTKSMASGSIWGRVDYFDSPEIINGPLVDELACQPPEISWQLDENGGIIGPALDRGEAYVFCSEKGDKRALICISQKTDDPELAEQIFSTFRWLD